MMLDLCLKKPSDGIFIDVPTLEQFKKSRLKEYADDNFKFDLKCSNVPQNGRTHSMERRNCLMLQCSPKW